MAEQKTFSVRVTYSVRVTVAAEPVALTVEVWREEGRVVWQAFGSRNSPSRLGI